jgi:hypothetical protein
MWRADRVVDTHASFVAPAPSRAPRSRAASPTNEPPRSAPEPLHVDLARVTLRAPVGAAQRMCDGCAEEIDENKPQPKLEVGAPDDEYEQEADRVADAVMRMPEEKVQREAITPKEDEEEKVQTAAVSAAVPTMTPHRATGVAAARKGGGAPLAAAERSFFESRMGFDFSRVRIHDSDTAAHSAHSLKARAYTLGSDIVFAAGQYAPGTGSGRLLLAHELTHVVQQNAAAPREPRSTDTD